jgi:hypothetical protein
VSTTAADFGVVGNAYTSTLAATGGTAPFTWTVFGGVLPSGLSLNAGTGVVSGIPGAPAGNFNATFTVTDSTGKTATGSVLFAIHPRTDLLSVNNGVPPVPSNGASSVPSISGDGRIVAFASLAGNLSSGGVGSQIYVHDWQTNQTTLISKNGTAALPTGGNGGSTAPSISGDGRFVAFVSNATDLLPVGSPVTGQQILCDRPNLVVCGLKQLGTPATQGQSTFHLRLRQWFILLQVYDELRGNDTQIYPTILKSVFFRTANHLDFEQRSGTGTGMVTVAHIH